MKDDNQIIIGAIIGFIVGILLPMLFSETHSEIIKRGHGQYNQQTGNFEWKDNK